MFRALLLRSVNQKITLRCEMEAMSHCCADGKKKMEKKSKSKRDRYQNWRPWIKRDTNKLYDCYPHRKIRCQIVFSCIPIWVDLLILSFSVLLSFHNDDENGECLTRSYQKSLADETFVKLTPPNSPVSIKSVVNLPSLEPRKQNRLLKLEERPS